MNKTVMVYLPEESKDEKRDELNRFVTGLGGNMPGIIFKSSTVHNAMVSIPENRLEECMCGLNEMAMGTVPPIVLDT